MSVLLPKVSKKLQAARDKFKQHVTQFIVKIGAVPHPKGYDGYVLQTGIGELRIHPYDNWIATCFSDNFAASLFCECNPHSGKWNWHYSDSATSLNQASLIADFEHAIAKLLLYVPTAAQVAKALELNAESKAWHARLLAQGGPLLP